MNIQLADLKREYDLRTVWPNEAYDFTPWLENNLNLLGEAIGVDLCFRERESAVGKFSLDILASDRCDRKSTGKFQPYTFGSIADLCGW